MRKRPVARPLLEPVEDRLVLSAAGILASLNPIGEVRTAIAGLSAQHSHAATAKTAHHPTTHAATAQATHHATTHGGNAKSVATHPHAAATTHAHQKSSSTTTNSLSNFFKSVFPGL